VWQANYGFNTGVASTNGATTVGTSDPRLYRTNRWSRDPLI
jgi:hypothetical protein